MGCSIPYLPSYISYTQHTVHTHTHNLPYMNIQKPAAANKHWTLHPVFPGRTLLKARVQCIPGGPAKRSRSGDGMVGGRNKRNPPSRKM